MNERFNDELKRQMDIALSKLRERIVAESGFDQPKCYAPEYCYCDACVSQWKRERGLVC
jgi:hypothetical protein